MFSDILFLQLTTFLHCFLRVRQQGTKENLKEEYHIQEQSKVRDINLLLITSKRSSNREVKDHTEINLHFFQNDSLSVGSTTERIGLPAGAQMGLFVIFIRPSLLPAVVHVFPSCPQTSGLTCWKKSLKTPSERKNTHEKMNFNLFTSTKAAKHPRKTETPPGWMKIRKNCGSSRSIDVSRVEKYFYSEAVYPGNYIIYGGE